MQILFIQKSIAFLLSCGITLLMITSVYNPKLDWHTRLDEAKKEAEGHQKNILMVFSGSDWCKPCIVLKEKVLLDAPFLKYAQDHLVLLNLDFPRKKKNQADADQTEHNELMAEKYNQEGAFPKVLLLNSQGKIIRQINHIVSSSQEFIDKLKQP